MVYTNHASRCRSEGRLTSRQPERAEADFAMVLGVLGARSLTRGVRETYDDETGSPEPATLRAVDFLCDAPIRLWIGSRRPDRVRPSLLLGSTRITDWSDSD